MAYQHNVLAMMVSALWFELGDTAPSDGVGDVGGLGGIGTVAMPPALFGVPEPVPELTFVVEALAGDNGFIASAINYHDTYGLNPTTITSLENLAAQLNAGSGHINRMRFVGHVGLNAASGDANINVAFFQGGQRVVTKQMLTGFGTSDELGLRAILDLAHQDTFQTPTSPMFSGLTVGLQDGLSITNKIVLSPFGLPSMSLTGDLAEYMWVLSDILFTRLSADPDYFSFTSNGTAISATNRTQIIAALDTIAGAIEARLINSPPSGLTLNAGHFTNLRTALDALHYYHLLNFVFVDIAHEIINAIRSADATLLAPLGLDSAGSPDSGSDTERFFFACSDRVVADLVRANPSRATMTIHGGALTNSQKDDLRSSIDVRISFLITEIANAEPTVNATQLTALRDAILGLSYLNLGQPALNDRDFVFTQSFGFTSAGGLDIPRLVGEANGALGRSFRADLTAAKARFDANSWVDIRGCRVGQDEDYLRALQTFFGQSGDAPSVSGPRWFQNFSTAGSNSFVTEGEFNNLWQDGRTWMEGAVRREHTSAQIHDVFDEASRYAGTGTHIDFWRSVSGLDDFAFAATVWKGSLPALPIEASRLADFNTLNFTDSIGRIAEIFDVVATAPTGATLTRIQALHDHVFDLQTEIETIAELGDPTVATELSASFGRLQGINAGLGLAVVPGTEPSPLARSDLDGYTVQLKKHVEIVTLLGGPADLFDAWLAVEALAGQSSPPAADLTAQFTALLTIQTTIGASGIVDATEPADLDADRLQEYVTQLTDHLVNASDLQAFREAVSAKANHNSNTDDLAEFRYYFFIGLALLIDDPTTYHFYALHAHEDAAIQSFMRAHWQGELPMANQIAASGIGTNDARQLSMLNEDRALTVMVFNPYEDFHDEIVEIQSSTP